MAQPQGQRSADGKAARQRAVKAHARGERNLSEIANAADRSESQTSQYLSDAGLSCHDPVDGATAATERPEPADVDLNLSYTDEPAAHPLAEQPVSPLRADGRYSQSTVDTALRRSSEGVVEDVMRVVEDRLQEVDGRVWSMMVRYHPEVDDDRDVADSVTLWLDRMKSWLLRNARAVANAHSNSDSPARTRAMLTPWVAGDEQGAQILYRYLAYESWHISGSVADELNRAFSSPQPSDSLKDQSARVATALDEELEATLVYEYEREVISFSDYLISHRRDEVFAERDKYLAGDTDAADRYNNHFNHINEAAAWRIEQGLQP